MLKTKASSHRHLSGMKNVRMIGCGVEKADNFFTAEAQGRRGAQGDAVNSSCSLSDLVSLWQNKLRKHSCSQ